MINRFKIKDCCNLLFNYRRRSLPLSGLTATQLADHYSSCIKLSAENVRLTLLLYAVGDQIFLTLFPILQLERKLTVLIYFKIYNFDILFISFPPPTKHTWYVVHFNCRKLMQKMHLDYTWLIICQTSWRRRNWITFRYKIQFCMLSVEE